MVQMRTRRLSSWRGITQLPSGTNRTGARASGPGAASVKRSPPLARPTPAPLHLLRSVTTLAHTPFSTPSTSSLPLCSHFLCRELIFWLIFQHPRAFYTVCHGYLEMFPHTCLFSCTYLLVSALSGRSDCFLPLESVGFLQLFNTGVAHLNSVYFNNVSGQSLPSV